MKFHIFTKDHQIKEATLEEWDIWLKSDLRVVKITIIGDMKISTLFLGMGIYDPYCFETMVFGETDDHFGEWRCHTYEQALIQHEDVCNKVKAKFNSFFNN